MANFNYQATTASALLPELLSDLLDHGNELGSRNGRVKELAFTSITLTEPWKREILTPGRKASLPAQIFETCWVLAGRNDVEGLKPYLPRAVDYSDDGSTWRSGYGPRLRNWNGQDQWAQAIKFLHADPTTRQAVISIWDPAQDGIDGNFKDRACNAMAQFLSRDGYLDMHIFVRSNDAMWGWSNINTFEWSTMLEVTARILNLRVGSLHFSVSSFHLYAPHWDKARTIVEASGDNSGWDSNGGVIFYNGKQTIAEFDSLLADWFEVEKEIRVHGPATVRAKIETFREPMLRSWLRVLAYYWSDDVVWLKPLNDTRLYVAALSSPKRPKDVEPALKDQGGETSGFIEAAIALHDEKHAAYGDSWKKRGEQVSILANIARKVDRLGGSETADETSLDTAMDTMIYLAKYRVWLDDPSATNSTEGPNNLLREIDQTMAPSHREAAPDHYVDGLNKDIKSLFETLFEIVSSGGVRSTKVPLVEAMLRRAYSLSLFLHGVAAQQPEIDEYRGADVD